jgi:hypothetical protein
MLDATLVLQEAELLLDGHYTAWQQQMVGRVRVYEKPQPQQSARQGSPALAKMNGSSQHIPARERGNPMPNSSRPLRPATIGDAVANVFMLFLLTVLSERLRRGRSR